MKIMSFSFNRAIAKESSGAVLISLRKKLNPDTCNLTQILLLP